MKNLVNPEFSFLKVCHTLFHGFVSSFYKTKNINFSSKVIIKNICSREFLHNTNHPHHRPHNPSTQPIQNTTPPPPLHHPPPDHPTPHHPPPNKQEEIIKHDFILRLVIRRWLGVDGYVGILNS